MKKFLFLMAACGFLMSGIAAQADCAPFNPDDRHVGGPPWPGPEPNPEPKQKEDKTPNKDKPKDGENKKDK